MSKKWRGQKAKPPFWSPFSHDVKKMAKKQNPLFGLLSRMMSKNNGVRGV
jgi:hypothetical protein